MDMQELGIGVAMRAVIGINECKTKSQETIIECEVDFGLAL